MTGKGTYSLLLKSGRAFSADVGSLGSLDLEECFVVYTGSAFGPGGLKRVERHRQLCRTGEGSIHWHVDYLLTRDEVEWIDHFSTGRQAECEVARAIPGEAVEGFGCSDCDCSSHLHLFDSKSEAVTVLNGIYGQ